MRPAASRAGAPPLSALIPIEKNGSPQGVTSQATPWRDARRQREPGACAKSRQATTGPGGATVAPSGAFLVVSAALVAGAAGAVAGDVVSAASTEAASRPTASRDAAIRFIVREPPGPLLHGTGPRGYGGASLRARVLTRWRRWARSVRTPG